MKALILVDIQNDFVPGGALAVGEGDRVVPVANRLMARFRLVVATKDWHSADHCNLRCDGCCSLSPYLPKWYIEPEDLRRDLALARRSLAPTWFKLVGGEPLPHPELVQCLRIARDSPSSRETVNLSAGCGVNGNMTSG